MATSKRWLTVAVTLAVMCNGSVDASKKCPTGFADCRPYLSGCKTCIFKDPKNCGRCGNSCKVVPNAVTPCKDGKCCEPECRPGYGNCDRNIWKNGCEKSLMTDATNCGKCGYCCPKYANAVASCKYGKCCPPVCRPGYGNCDKNIKNGCEKSLLTDPTNCGKCGNRCPTHANAVPAVCQSGKCLPVPEPMCNPGFGNCDGDNTNGCETNLLSDLMHCGDCSFACVTDPRVNSRCNNGACLMVSCPPGFGNCNPTTSGCETSLLDDPANCGSCNFVCLTSVCKDGQCHPSE